MHYSAFLGTAQAERRFDILDTAGVAQNVKLFLREWLRTQRIQATPAGGFRLADNFSLGGGVSLMRGRLDNDAEFIAPLPETLPDGRFGLNLYAPNAQAATSRTRMHGSDWTFNAGFLWKPTPQWGFGSFFRLGPTFALSNEDQALYFVGNGRERYFS